MNSTCLPPDEVATFERGGVDLAQHPARIGGECRIIPAIFPRNRRRKEKADASPGPVSPLPRNR
jgi:hypothetical protein